MRKNTRAVTLNTAQVTAEEPLQMFKLLSADEGNQAKLG